MTSGLRGRWRGSFAWNLASVGASTLANKLLGVFLVGYTARMLGPAMLGEVSFATSATAYASILLSPGLAMWGTRRIAQNREQASETLAIVNFAQLALSVIAYGSLALFAISLEDRGQGKLVLIAGLGLFNTALTVDWVFAGLELMRVASALYTITSTLALAGLLIFLKGPEHAGRYLIILFAAGLSVNAYSYVLLARKHGVRFTAPGISATKESIVSSIPLGTTAALVVLLKSANIFIIGYFLGNVALGLFAAAARLVDAARIMQRVISNVFLPRLARLAATHAPRARQEATLSALAHASAGLLLAAFIFAEAPVIIAVFFGPQFARSALVLRILSVAVLANYLICGQTNCLIAFRQDKVMVKVVLASAVVAIAGGLLLVPRYGLVGAAIAVSCIDLAGWLSSLPTYVRVIGSLQLMKWMYPILGALALIAVSSVLQKTGIAAPYRIFAELLAAFPFAWKMARDLKHDSAMLPAQ